MANGDNKNGNVGMKWPQKLDRGSSSGLLEWSREMKGKRKQYKPEFKAQVALAALPTWPILCAGFRPSLRKTP